MTSCCSGVSTPASAWDRGITWRNELVEVSPSNFLALDVSFVSDKVVRAVTDGHEDDLIASYIRTATEMCEAYTFKSVRPQRRQQIMSGFPAGPVEIQYGPVREIVSVEYYDGDNALQAYGGSPPSYVLVPGTRPTLELGVGESWPSTATRAGAVVITYDAGYERAQDIPHLIRTGIGIVVAELYKNPDLSNADSQAANLLNLDFFWKRRW